jgi:hypothetical protein
LFALLSSDAVTDWAPVLPFASMRTPTSLKEPDRVFAPEAVVVPGNRISIRELVVLSVTLPFVIVANTPLAPSIRIGSAAGIEGARVNVAGDDVIGEGYVILNVVVVSTELAMI